uniref:WSC domain-containing protein n=1 Tax=Macrostomum lignano TaxID=282301 RepID=A0A1I8I8B1_9PLAT
NFCFVCAHCIGEKAADVPILGLFRRKRSPANRDLVGLKGLAKLGPHDVTIPAQGLTSIATMSVDLCSELCSLGGFTYFGVQAASYCSCDFTYGSFGTANESDCYMNCVGDASQKCGNSYRNSMYKITYLKDSSFSFIPDLVSSPVLLDAAYPAGVISNRMSAANTLLRCLLDCQENPVAMCQAVLFEASGRRCHQLTFAAIPTDLGGSDGEFWAR